MVGTSYTAAGKSRWGRNGRVGTMDSLVSELLKIQRVFKSL